MNILEKKSLKIVVKLLSVVVVSIFFVGCSPSGGRESSSLEQSIFLQPLSWGDIPILEEGSFQKALPALLRSCEILSKKDPQTPLSEKDLRFGLVKDWWPFCSAVSETFQRSDVKQVSTHLLLGEYLQPFKIKEKNKVFSWVGLGGLFARDEGLFTGYYEPVLKGSLTQTIVYNTPLYEKPSDLVTADLSSFHSDFDARRLVGRVEGQKLVPYYTRKEIEKGALTAQEPLLWLQNSIDKFFLQIQGSGRIFLPDGKQVFVGYGGANGHMYTAIGRYMVQRGFLKQDDVSMQTIRAWLEAHPEALTEVLHQNESYVFFKRYADGPYGTQGVLLTPEHSLAVDPRAVPLGVPVFLKTTLSATGAPFNKLMVTQDTGGAIKGSIRGDIYFGYGEGSAHLAGHQKSPGTLFVLLPKEISATNKE